MSVIYQVVVEQIGDFAQDALQDNMLIMFKSGAPADVVDYCFVHSHDDLKQPLAVGGELQINAKRYPITAVGEVASENLAQLGHITLFFDGASEAQFPGSIHLQGDVPNEISVGSEFVFLNN
ncbi:PTS system glucitol/sorbitol-specific IIA component [Bibersteinia trehalosi USDA-ARS-USMARC-188]|uniref:PTS system glucitol/sorbitol-specific IIA component n=5 Tax=Bibersteinia trehalosi TaxID=47735 RepID=W0R6W8_BIBTR|nr:PTS glucitol/sorbitol transporter subunit IIA [Bibersteinia trehalosi]AGH38053.1 PTS system glucitol/sorbitol-specific IIA component [Bibersteinia trehalosi USDA-ARS-USMARC-192]AHG82147.1 PTS system glucitol/sorbitol-specific IIA component [Bibersteinia trehalosi USDA-ARS-USMARC-188]AHG84458.1 PTS system glucitol/sorbitol-specific IIA component [Bibersteinia trehalosi USDA-ARS-USMARC-189]AHG86040.1 PTS system glucitol/sorbitol-specific IIA component [Bibersteinia trehalosi USDA-ARS-USMARC-19